MKQRILMVGGGSGGHVTPLLAIVRSLQKDTQVATTITVMTDRAFYPQTKLLAQDVPIHVKKIYAGKYRRYHGKSFLWHLTHLPTVWRNLRDIVFLAIGTLQSFWYFLWHRPDVVFCKGGYVCVPVGLMARCWRVPLIIHDSDTHPGLTNRFLSRWARVIATGMPPHYYRYPKHKMVYTGIPVGDAFHPLDTQKQRALRGEHQLGSDKPLLLVTGGGTGAESLNTACTTITPQLLADGWQIVHFTGKGKGSAVENARSRLSQALQRDWHVYEFADITPYVQMADLIVSRAGATAVQEFANAQKAVVLVPNPHLTGGHQLKNAAMFEDAGAVAVLSQDEVTEHPESLYALLHDLQNNTARRKKMATVLHQAFAKPDAADELAAIIAQHISENSGDNQ